MSRLTLSYVKPGLVSMWLRRPVALAALVSLSFIACGGDDEATVPIETAAVERRDITVNAEATGAVEPINVVEVKSKASGQVTEMPVDVGSMVTAGQLLVQIDTRDVRNNYDQTVAALRAAQAKLEVSQAQKKRSDDLFAQDVITAQEHETATLDYVSSQSAVVKARTDADLARQRLEDATVRAPIAGTVIEKPVSQGQVITSATSGPTGGTTLLKMADLSRVRIRTLVNETDIGNVKAGQPATVVVDAFPDRRFRGTVEKVEPQAVIQQSVTTFPVLISLDNSDRQLMPGMNGQVTMLIEQREDVLAVPADAIRTMRELPTVARALGLDPDAAQTEVRSQIAAARGGATRRTDSAGGAVASNGNGGTADSTAVASTRRRRRNGNGGGTGVPAAPQQGDAGVQLPLGGNAAGGAAARSASVVFVKNADGGFAPRAVRTGITNFDYTEVIGGVKEGDQVALLGSAVLQQQRADQNDRIRNAQSGALTGGAPAGGGGGAGRRP
jgi:HlyD family secretion protein